MEQFDYYINLLVGGLVVPLLEWIKVRYPNLNPASKVLVSLAMVTGITLGISQFVLPTPLPFQQVIDYAFKSQVVAQLIHALYNTNPKTPTEVK